MNISKTIAIICCGLVFSACASVVRVSKSPDEKVNGIPFYLKVERFKQTTTYREQWVEATATVFQSVTDAKGKVVERPIAEFSHAFKSVALPELRLVQQKLVAPANDQVFGDALKRFLEMAADPNLAGPDPVEAPYSNTVEPVAVVDYSQQYFINAPQPWFGKSNLAAKINADGTLAETTAGVESTLGESVASLLPIKEFLTGKYVPVPKSDNKITTEAVPQTVLARATMTLERKGMAYKFTGLSPTNPCTQASGCPAIAFNRAAGNYTAEALGALAGGKEEDGKSAITVRGTIELPKPKEE